MLRINNRRMLKVVDVKKKKHNIHAYEINNKKIMHKLGKLDLSLSTAT